MADRIGTEIAGYRIQSLLARGGMGEVYLAMQDFPERKVALKLLPHELASDQAFRERFIRESNAAASVEHASIVPVYGAGESDGELWIAMRYIEGEDLRALLDREGPLPPERAALICAQVADALEEAHEHDLVHRDVKPGNILVAKGDRAYLSDFGLIRRSKLETGLTKTGQFMGTVDYVAPEQIRGELVDGRADVYSLGCVLYECLVGEPPFGRDTEVATLYAHLEDPPPNPSVKRPELPASLNEIVAKAMAKKPEARYPTAGEIAQTLKASPSQVGSSSRIGTRAILYAAGAVTLVIAGLAFLLNTGDGGGGMEKPSGGTTAAIARPGTVVGVDPETGELVRALGGPGLGALGDKPQMVVGEGSIWAAGGFSERVGGGFTSTVGVDLESGDVQILAQKPRLSPIVTNHLVWFIGSIGAASIVVTDPATGQTIKVIRFSHAPAQMAFGQGDVFVTFPEGTLAKVSSRTFRVVATKELPGAEYVALSEGNVLVVDKLGGLIRVLDARTLEEREEIELQGDIGEIVSGDEGTWVLDPTSGSVTEIDIDEGGVGRSWDVGTGVRDIDLGFGAIWAARSDGTLLRVDPLTGTNVPIEIGNELGAVAVEHRPGGLVWVYTS